MDFISAVKSTETPKHPNLFYPGEKDESLAIHPSQRAKF
jgi:hypothetical protein